MICRTGAGRRGYGGGRVCAVWVLCWLLPILDPVFAELPAPLQVCSCVLPYVPSTICAPLPGARCERSLPPAPSVLARPSAPTVACPLRARWKKQASTTTSASGTTRSASRVGRIAWPTGVGTVPMLACKAPHTFAAQTYTDARHPHLSSRFKFLRCELPADGQDYPLHTDR